MPELSRYMTDRLDPASKAFDTRLEIAFAASPPGTPADAAFGTRWTTLPEGHRRAIADAWRAMQESQSRLPAVRSAG